MSKGLLSSSGLDVYQPGGVGWPVAEPGAADDFVSGDGTPDSGVARSAAVVAEDDIAIRRDGFFLFTFEEARGVGGRVGVDGVFKIGLGQFFSVDVDMAVSEGDLFSGDGDDALDKVAV